MSKVQRVESFLIGIVMILLAVIMIRSPELGYYLVIFILGITLLIYGIRSLIYYFTMACHMVGGKAILYKGFIIFDLGIFTFTLTDIPIVYVLLYLIGVHLISGGLDILSAIDAKKAGSHSWRLKLIGGILSILIAVACIIYRNSTTLMVYIYSSGLIYSGIFKIISAFRKTAIVYIQ